MIRSMTGYGGAKSMENAIAVTVELRSVNNRYLDVSVRLPKSCLFAEETVRTAVSRHISRGKVDVFIGVDTSGAEESVIKVNENLAAAYLKAVRDAAERFGLEGEIDAITLLRFPEVLSTDKTDTDRDTVSQAIAAVLEQGLAEFDAMRTREGQRLAADIEDKLRSLEDMVAIVEARSPQTVTEYREKLLGRMKEVLADAAVDEARILQEAAIYADKVAVDEEMVRLKSHIAQFRILLAQGSPAGRKLDFLTQEMNREANTTGSKCADSTIAKTVIDMKAEIEKIREQIQNIE